MALVIALRCEVGDGVERPGKMGFLTWQVRFGRVLPKMRLKRAKKREKIVAYLAIVLFFSWIDDIVRTRRESARI